MPGRAAPKITPGSDGTVSVTYQAAEPGIHEVSIVCNEKPADGTPFRCHVDKVGSGFVTAYGSGLVFGTSGKESAFTVVGGGSKPDVTVDGPSKPEVKLEQAGGATKVTYVPMSPGEYKVNIKSGGKHIHGSPFIAAVSGEGRKRSQMSLAATSDVSLGAQISDLTGVLGVVKSPSGSSDPCLLKKMPDGTLGVASFCPKSKGTYQVVVTQDKGKFPGSPFKIEVGEGQMVNPGKVKVGGAIRAGEANKLNDITFDCTQAGYGTLAVSIEGAHRCDIESKETGPGNFTVSYKPHEPGLYMINLQFGLEPIPGSPFMAKVGGQPSGRVRETVMKDIAPAAPCGIGSKCEFQLKIPGTDPLDMEALLTFPSGKSDLCEIRDLADSLYDIKFTPVEEGVHTVSLKHRGLHIAGSPFQYTVGQPPNAGSYKVEIGGPGLERGEVKVRNEFNIYTREAGGGKLEVSVEGPSKAHLDVIDRGNGYTTVTYTVDRDGEYGIHVKWDDQHVPDSPAMVYISPEAADARKCAVQGLKDRGLEANKATTFTVNKNGGKGQLKAYLETPSGAEDIIYCQELDSDMNAMRFTPKENGIYYAHIKLNEAHIPGSPFPMLVGKMSSDPALVMAKGDGLDKADTGKPAKFQVMTVNCGIGTLLVQIEGPSKVAIQCSEIDEGYEFTYVPMAPGDYLITIKYCNVTIAGCPTKAKVSGSGKPSAVTEQSSLAIETVEKKPGAVATKRFFGDASKIVAKGNGLKKSFLNRPANFTIELKDAGNSLLTVGMITPDGNPVDELTYKKQRGTTYQIVYKSAVKGEHTMHIRWGNEDIPGSPFGIQVG
jgi:filamin